MKALTKNGMVKWFSRIMIAGVLALATSSTGHAMSSLISLTMEPAWPTNSNPGTVILYNISAISRAGQGMLEVSLSVSGLPEGATVSFSPSVLRFTGRVPEVQTATMIVTCPRVMPLDDCAFTLTGTAQRETVSITNQPVVLRQMMVAERVSLELIRTDAGALLRGIGPSGGTYDVEAADKLAGQSWVSAGSTTADGNGRFIFKPAFNTNIPMRFYRTASPSVAP